MFRYEEPLFEKKRLLRVDMLEQLRDYPRDYLKILYQGYSEGIVCGCQVSWNDGKLTISPVILHHGEKLYFMERPYTIDCRSEDKVRYLKVQFLAEVKENGKILENTRIVLDEAKPDMDCEMELCRFRLQEGARLRNTYENFEDYSTEYDTINSIYAPYAAKNESILNPVILDTFASECLRHGAHDPVDVNFALNILSGYGQVSAACVREYLYLKLRKEINGNIDTYRGLLKVLGIHKSAGAEVHSGEQGKRSIMLF